MENIVMKIAFFQSELTWENPAENRKNIERYFRNTPQAIDLFVLPEMFTTGFTMHPHEVAETLDAVSYTHLRAHETEL
jgi:omega-amidase